MVIIIQNTVNSSWDNKITDTVPEDRGFWTGKDKAGEEGLIYNFYKDFDSPKSLSAS